MAKPRCSGIGVAVSVLSTVFAVYFLQSIFSDFLDFNGNSLLPSSGKSKLSTKTVVKNMAFEVTTLRQKASEDLQALKETLEHVNAGNENQGKMIADVLQEVSRNKDSQEQVKAMEEQQKMTKDILNLVEKQAKDIEEQKAALSLQQKEMKELKAHLSAHDNSQARGEGPQITGFLYHGDPKEWKQRTFTHHGTHGFIHYSSYRLARNKFASTGFAALDLKEKRFVDGCTWHNSDGSTVSGELTFMFAGDHHEMKYEAVVLYCVLDDDSGSEGGYLVATVDFENIVLLYEDKMPDLQVPDTFDSKLTLCGPPVFAPLDARAVWEWFEYHRVIIGVDKFVFYDVGAMDQEVVDALQDYVKSGTLEINHSPVPYNTWYFGQMVFSHDCMFSRRLTSKWVIMIDMDEYVAAVPPHTVASILADHDDKPWLTHGSVWWGLDQCNKGAEGDKNEFGIERMVFRWPHDYCMHEEKYPNTEYCLLHFGHRKFIANPRKVELLSIHYVPIPKDGGVDLNVNTEMRHHHYQGFNGKGRTYAVKSTTHTYCKEQHGDDEKVEWWTRDYSMADTVPRILACPFGNKTCVAHVKG